MMDTGKVSRRGFIIAGGAALGGLSLGVYFTLPEDSDPFGRNETSEIGDIGAWLRIDKDESITLFVPQAEMGQGVFTSLPMLIAEELEVDWHRVKAEYADDVRSTGGSHSIRQWFTPLRKVGAAARGMLIAAAARQWAVEPADCVAENGMVYHAGTGRQSTYGSLAEAAARETVPPDPELKTRDQRRYLGQPVPRLDLPAKVNGSAVFGLDIRLPGMVFAAVRNCPIFGGRIVHFDSETIAKIPGVSATIEVPGGIAVVANNSWQALRAAQALPVSFATGGAESLSSEKILRDYAQAGPEDSVVVRDDGQTAKAFEAATKRIAAEYTVPYLAHACMEPQNCTARVTADGCEIWVGTQDQSSARKAAAKAAGLPEEKVKVNVTFLGGGFGRRGETDIVTQAVTVARTIGRPVKLLWSREEDTQHDFYRPLVYGKLEAALDPNGLPTAWTHKAVSQSILERFAPKATAGGKDFTSTEGAANMPYGIANVRVDYALRHTPVPVGWWRSVGSSQNAFITESFIDEVAHAGGHDPFDLRRRLLDHAPRHKAVLERVAEMASWSRPLPDRVGRGIAVHECFGSIVGQVAEVEVDAEGGVHVRRVVCVIDCGEVVNTDTIVAQMESGIIYGLTAALYGRVTIEKGRAVESNFHDYPMVRLAQAPKIETYVTDSEQPPGGVGEPGTPPIAPAVTNAIYAVTGIRIRDLPISDHDLKV